MTDQVQPGSLGVADDLPTPPMPNPAANWTTVPIPLDSSISVPIPRTGGITIPVPIEAAPTVPIPEIFF